LEGLEEWFKKYPDLVNEITTGEASPLHMCGMSKTAEQSTEIVIRYGGDIEFVDTYGFRPLHRMASNNLAVGAEALLKAGADPSARTMHGETPIQIAQASRAYNVIKVLQRFIR
jgi:ankyrin repeat protein